MRKTDLRMGQCLLALAGWLAVTGAGWAAPAAWRTLPGHVPSAVPGLVPVGTVPATNRLHLAIGLPLRDPAGLDALLAQLADPASTNYHRYLTPDQFTERFGPTAADYAAVTQFAATNGLAVTATHGNRLLLDVAGSAADIQRAFRLTLRTYHHPTEARDFYAPDTEPSVAADLPVADISGLSDFSRPHPMNLRSDTAMQAGAVPRTGSGSGGAYLGGDFRAAYLPGVTLTGTGQQVGLVQFDGFYSNDITTYETAAGLPAVPLQTVLLDGYDGTPTTGTGSGNVEVSLDIEMCVSMAPGLAGIVLFEAGPSGTPNDILNSMVASNSVKQLSCSWGWGGGPTTTTDNIFKQMAADGQSFFNAAGDDDAFTLGSSSVNGVDNTSLATTPASSPYITQVGGTTLTTSGAGGSWVSEKVWNWNYDASSGTYAGTCGGVSSYYSIPAWQTNVSMSANGGSTTYRNIPDVAMTADNVFVDYANGSSASLGGTSCATPLWAAFTALVNQQAVAAGKSPVGFLNPALYSLGAAGNYNVIFHDITTGSNCWPTSPGSYYAVAGYDLCTGWGTPAGQALINALAGTATLGVSPLAGAAYGTAGGPFTISAGNFLLTNSGNSSLAWSLINTSAWLKVSATNGTLAAAAQTNLTCSLTATASNLLAGTYAASLIFSNATAGVAQFAVFTLSVNSPMTVSPTNGFTATGAVGGPFPAASQTFTLTNLSGSAQAWGIVNTSAWLTASPAGGTVAGNAKVTLAISLAAAADLLPAGVYTATVAVTNRNGAVGSLPFTLSAGQSIMQNGGFETGSFSGWTLVGDTIVGSGRRATIYDAVESSSSAYPLVVHSGSYGAFLGDNIVATLSQTLATVPGQNYYLSLWLDSSVAGTGQLFQVYWNGNFLAGMTNPPVFTWSNLQYLVTATGTNTTLQFAVENAPNYFGLDDVAVTPVPVAGFRPAVSATNRFTLAWNTATNLVYQVQYKTNLMQANWLNFGSPLTATNSVLSLTDTNPLTPQFKRFYRLSVSP